MCLPAGVVYQAWLAVDLINQGEARREMQRSVPKSEIDSVTKTAIMKPQWARSIIFFPQKAVDSGDRVEEGGPFPMACRMVLRDHSEPTSTWKPLAA